MSFISYLINGVSLGSIYAIIALGYTMVYGIAKMLNFAHGDVIMIGCYIVFVLMGSFHLNSTVSIIAAVIGCTVLGVVIEKIAYKPLRKASPLAVLITAIGVSYFLQNFALILFGADTKSFTSVVSIPTIKLAGGDLTISGVTIATVISCIIIMAALMIFIKKSKSGQAMLAVSEDKDAAQLMGVNVNKTISLTFAIGSGLAAIAGVLLCSAYPTLSPYTGAMPGIKAFTAAVFGGIGSIPGALIGGILLGVIEILGRAYISSQLSDAIVFAVLIIRTFSKTYGTSCKPGSGESVGGVRNEEIKYEKYKQTDKKYVDYLRYGNRSIYYCRDYDIYRNDVESDAGSFSSALYLFYRSNRTESLCRISW